MPMVKTTRISSSYFICVALRKMNIMHVQLPLERMPKKDFLEIGTLHNYSKSHGYTFALETMATQYAFA